MTFSWQDLGYSIAGLAGGGALLYSSKFVPGKWKALPVVAGLAGIGVGGYFITRVLAEQGTYEEPPDPQYGDVNLNILHPVNGGHYSCMLFYPIRVAIAGNFPVDYTIGVRSIEDSVDIKGEVIDHFEHQVATGILPAYPKSTEIVGMFKNKCYFPWVTYRVKFQAIKVSTGKVIGESSTIEYTSAYI